LVETFLRYARDKRFAAELYEPEIAAGLRRFASEEEQDAQSTNALAS
jgi:hypothetical protein